MAAISTLMVNELPLRTDRLEEDQTPTAHRAVTRMASPSTLMDSSHHRFANDQQRQTTPDQRSGYASSNTSPLRLTTENLQKAARAQDSPDVMDIDADPDEGDGSDNETEPGDSNSMSRKKKGQRFFCTGYPPCNLSFTRSEHLARHIRKHTGERPFQCHCNRRFSRLDNLRQHAQTVHVNEEIPTDSLAATGTRFQRQIRTDRIRPTGRPRSGTMSSTGTHSRGHSRNLSASSIGSTSSNFSTSTVDARRRQPPLLMASEVRPKLGLDLPRTPPQQFATYTTLSPSDLKTPRSATFSATPGSPAFGAATASPLASVSRASVYAGTRLPARRLSVPTAPNVYAPGFRTPTHSFSNPGGPPGGTLSPEISTVPSPTSSTFSHTPTLDSSSGEDWRRRTWHPSSYLGLNTNYNRPATSGLTYSQTPDAPQPAFAPNATAAAGQAPRLPGIESFDHVQQRPSTPPRTNSTGFLGESTRPPPLTPLAGHRRHVSADVSRYNVQPYTHDRAARLGPTSSWMNDSMTPPYQAGARLRTQMPEPLNSQLTSHGHTSTQTLAASPSIPSDARGKLGPSAFANPTLHHPSTPATRVSPEDSGSSEGVATPGTSGSDVHPTIMPTSGVLDAQHTPITLENGPNPCIQTPTILPPLSVATHDHLRRDLHIHGNDLQQLNRLDALAAVATGSGDGGNRR